MSWGAKDFIDSNGMFNGSLRSALFWLHHVMDEWNRTVTILLFLFVSFHLPLTLTTLIVTRFNFCPQSDRNKNGKSFSFRWLDFVQAPSLIVHLVSLVCSLRACIWLCSLSCPRVRRNRHESSASGSECGGPIQVRDRCEISGVFSISIRCQCVVQYQCGLRRSRSWRSSSVLRYKLTQGEKTRKNDTGCRWQSHCLGNQWNLLHSMPTYGSRSGAFTR